MEVAVEKDVDAGLFEAIEALDRQQIVALQASSAELADEFRALLSCLERLEHTETAKL